MRDMFPIARLLVWLATACFLVAAAALTYQGQWAEGLIAFGLSLLSLAIEVVN